MPSWGLAAACLMALAAAAQAATPDWLVFASGKDQLIVSGDQAEVGQAQRTDNGWQVPVQLAPDQTAAFTRLSTDHVGDVLEVRLCGETIMRPRLMAPIESGVGVISFGTDARAEARLKALAERACAGAAQ